MRGSYWFRAITSAQAARMCSQGDEQGQIWPLVQCVLIQCQPQAWFPSCRRWPQPTVTTLLSSHPSLDFFWSSYKPYQETKPAEKFSPWCHLSAHLSFLKQPARSLCNASIGEQGGRRRQQVAAWATEHHQLWGMGDPGRNRATRGHCTCTVATKHFIITASCSIMSRYATTN